MNFFNDILNLLYPNNCVNCEISLLSNEDMLCAVCSFQLPKSPNFESIDNAVARVFWGRIPVEYANAYLQFQKTGSVKKLIHKFKYDNEPLIAEKLAVIAGKSLKKQLDKHNIRPDYIIPVPLHDKKLKLRGYNQCDYIANGISKSTSVPVEKKLLQKITNTNSQTKKGRYARWENVAEIFVVKDHEKYKNKHFLIVDDVITTGATIEACARTLLEIENVKISIFSLAYA